MRRLNALIALLLVLSGCVNRPPLGEPAIRGYITSVSPTQILVEENPNESAGSNKAAARISSDTQIVGADGSSRRPSELAVGQYVAVWFDGPVMESYPVQAGASRVAIERDANRN